MQHRSLIYIPAKCASNCDMYYVLNIMKYLLQISDLISLCEFWDIKRKLNSRVYLLFMILKCCRLQMEDVICSILKNF